MPPSLTPELPGSSFAERWFWRAWLITLAVKFLMSLTIPITGDEAYFITWGKHLDYGYYDHGAMTGWWLWAVLQLGDALWLVRSPAILGSQFIGWLLWRALRPHDAPKAAWAATLYLVSPLNVCNVLTTTDTPLMVLSAISAVIACRAARTGRAVDWLLTGLFLGGAFLAKYFAVLLGVSYAFWLLVLARPARIGALLLVFVGALPGILVNVAWNYHHAWTNILFNLVTRHAKAGFSLLPPLTFILFVAALAGPAVVTFCFRPRDRVERRSWREVWRDVRAHRLEAFIAALAVPHAIFLGVAFFHRVGVHWLLSFVVFLYPALFMLFGPEGLRRLIRPTAIYSGVFALAALAVPFIPLEWAGKKNGLSILLAARGEEVRTELQQFGDDLVLATPSYSKSALLGYLMRQPVAVIGPGSYHGRQDDIVTDLRQFDGRDILLVTDHAGEMERTRDWFASSEVHEPEVAGSRFYVVLGRDFDFPRYREDVLSPVAEKYYRIPPWLQPFAGPNFFRERYDLPQSQPLPSH